MTVDSETILAGLTETGILEYTDDGEELTVSKEFRKTLDAKWETVFNAEPDELRHEIAAVTDQSQQVDPLAGVGESDREFLGKFLSVREWLTDCPIDESVQIVFILDLFLSSVPEKGVPEPFLPLNHEHLDTAIGLSRIGIVYVWRHDCDPCDVVKEQFEDIFADGSDGMSLFAVYGPNDPQRLREEYDIGGAPTTLFVGDGQIDSRLISAHPQSTFEREIQTIRERFDDTSTGQ